MVLFHQYRCWRQPGAKESQRCSLAGKLFPNSWACRACSHLALRHLHHLASLGLGDKQDTLVYTLDSFRNTSPQALLSSGWSGFGNVLVDYEKKTAFDRLPFMSVTDAVASRGVCVHHFLRWTDYWRWVVPTPNPTMNGFEPVFFHRDFGMNGHASITFQ